MAEREPQVRTHSNSTKPKSRRPENSRGKWGWERKVRKGEVKGERREEGVSWCPKARPHCDALLVRQNTQIRGGGKKRES